MTDLFGSGANGQLQATSMKVDGALNNVQMGISSNENMLLLDEEQADDYTASDPATIAWDDQGGGSLPDDFSLPFHIINVVLQYQLAGFIVVIFLGVILLANVGIIWSLFLEFTILKDILVERRGFATVFAVADLIIAFIFREWLSRALTAYEIAPRQLHELMTRIRCLSEDYNSLLVRPTVAESIHHVKRLVIEEINDLMVALNYHSLRLYLEAEDQQHAHYSDALKERVDKWAFARTDTRQIMGCFVSDVRQNIKRAHMFTCITEAGMSRLLQHTDAVTTVLEQFHQGADIRTPGVFSVVLVTAMAFYLIVVTPITMYSQIDVYVCVVYPVVMALIFGPVFFRFWIKDPFERFSRFRGNHYYEWRSKNLMSLRQYRREALIRWEYESKDNRHAVLNVIDEMRRRYLAEPLIESAFVRRFAHALKRTRADPRARKLQ